MVDDDGVAVAAAKILGQQHMAAGGHDHRILRLLRLDDDICRGAPAVAVVRAALAVGTAHVLGHAVEQRRVKAVQERLHKAAHGPLDLAAVIRQQPADGIGGVVRADVGRHQLGLGAVILVGVGCCADRQRQRLGIEDITPEQSDIPATNFHITDDELGQGTPKEKFRANIMAIQLLKKCEEENRNATPDEQEILSRYVGWGGLADAFDETKSAWETEYLELKTVLTPEEYAAARASTLNAHYTQPIVIESMYQALENLGFTKGNILEPSMGVGNFFGMLPEKLNQSKLYGVELDSISGRIAKLLYPDANIQIKGFEKTDYPNDFFDVAIGNVPFGAYKVNDRQYDRYNFMIHDYFLAKTIDQLRPGGVAALITTKGTMDKASPETVGKLCLFKRCCHN